MYLTPNPTLERIAGGVRRERRHMALQHLEGGNNQSLLGWLLILKKELAEVEEAWLKGKGPAPVEALCELLQVYAVAQAAIEQYGVVERDYPPHLEEIIRDVGPLPQMGQSEP